MYKVEVIAAGKRQAVHLPNNSSINLYTASIKNELNLASGFTFSFLPNNPGWGVINPYTTKIEVTDLQKNSVIFYGRVTDDSEIIDARTNIKGKTFLTLKQHLDDIEMTSISGQLTDYTVEADYVLKIRDLGMNTDSIKYDAVANMTNQSDNNYALIVMGVRNLVLKVVAN